jgi:hypothetical protein
VWIPYPHLDRPGSECLLRSVRGRDRLRRPRKDDEEGVALCVNLDPAVRREYVAQDTAMLCQDLTVRLGAKLVQQLGRSLHVAEEEGDCSRRKISLHSTRSCASTVISGADV